MQNKYSWKLADLTDVAKNGYTVFSCFSCGGGSTMGYKLAGYDVVGNCELDEKMNRMYVKNHKPKYSYNLDVRDLVNQELPKELYDLDILDGSPPCSVFSMAGNREKDWNKERKFAEGQKSQRLDDLFFHYIAVAKKIQPKIIVAENVTGIIKGNAKGYVNEILKAFDDAGYVAQMFMLNAAFMEVPQRRERVFFICRRKDVELPPIRMKFDYKPILFGEVRSERGIEIKNGTKHKDTLKHYKKGDKHLSLIMRRVTGKKSGFDSDTIVCDDGVAATVKSAGVDVRAFDMTYFSGLDYIAVQTFPTDYDFCGNNIQYVCRMSVPPKMMYHISKQIQLQWLDAIRNNNVQSEGNNANA